MSIEEIFQRIVKAHAFVILLCTLLPLVAVLALEAQSPQLWQAKVRIQTVADAPISSTEAEGLSSRVLALATTPAIVSKAVGPDSPVDAVRVAEHQVTAERLGESSVVELIVTRQDQVQAKEIVAALAGTVTQFMNEADRARFEMLSEDVLRRLTAAVAERDALLEQLLGVRGERESDALKSALDAAQRRVDLLQEERATLSLADASRSRVVAIAADDPAVVKMPAALLPRAALALLLGLLLGLVVAVLIETLRPRIGGIRVLTRALDAPLLGNTNDRPAALANSMSLASRRQGVETVVLVGADERDERAVGVLLQELPVGRDSRAGVRPGVRTQHGRAGEPAGSKSQRREAGSGRPGDDDNGTHDPMNVQVRFTDLYGVTPSEEVGAGVVVLATGSTRRANLEALDDMLRALRWPLVGIVEHTHRRRRLVRR